MPRYLDGLHAGVFSYSLEITYHVAFYYHTMTRGQFRAAYESGAMSERLSWLIAVELAGAYIHVCGMQASSSSRMIAVGLAGAYMCAAASSKHTPGEWKALGIRCSGFLVREVFGGVVEFTPRRSSKVLGISQALWTILWPS